MGNQASDHAALDSDLDRPIFLIRDMYGFLGISSWSWYEELKHPKSTLRKFLRKNARGRTYTTKRMLLEYSADPTKKS
jgi:hypothetical protein